MNQLLNRAIQTWKNLQDMKPETIAMVRNTLFGVLFVDIFLVYWYLKFKSFAIAILIVALIFLTLILFIERRHGKKMEFGLNEEDYEESEEEPKKETKAKKPSKPKIKDKEEEEEGDAWDIDIGLPSAADYNERARKAFGSF